MTIAHANERDPAGRRASRRFELREWKRGLAAGVFWCSAVLFAGGVAAGLLFGGRIGYGLWQDRQEKQATLEQARRDCAGRYDPEEWGTAQQQFDGCVSDRMEPWTWRTEVHPLIYVFIAAPYALYMGVTGLTAWLAWDYRRDRLSRLTTR
jgi:hypothetical protein